MDIFITASRCWSVNLIQRCVPPCYFGAWHTKRNTFLRSFLCKNCIAAWYQVKLWLFWNTILIRIWWFDQKSFFRILLCQLMWVRVMAPRRDSLPLPHRCASAAGLRRFGFGVPSFQEIHFHGWNCPMSKQIVAPRRSEVFNIQCYLTVST